MQFLSAKLVENGVLERPFTLGEIPGILWTPATTPAPVPLILLGHPGGLDTMYPRLLARAESAVTQGFAAATIENPGSGERQPIADIDAARADLREALRTGEPVTEDIIDRLVLPLVDRSVPEWRDALSALLSQPEIRLLVGYSGGVIAIGTRLAMVEPRISAALLYAGSFVPRTIVDDAERVTIPLHVLLQWDDEHNDRQRSLNLFDAFGSEEKTLHANMGGHTGVPKFAGEEGGRFFARHIH